MLGKMPVSVFVQILDAILPEHRIRNAVLNDVRTCPERIVSGKIPSSLLFNEDIVTVVHVILQVRQIYPERIARIGFTFHFRLLLSSCPIYHSAVLLFRNFGRDTAQKAHFIAGDTDFHVLDRRYGKLVGGRIFHTCGNCRRDCRYHQEVK